MAILLWVLFTKCHLRSSHDDMRMMRGRRWYCHLASASLYGAVDSGRLIRVDVQAILG